MFRVCKRGSLLLLFFCASVVRLSLLRTPFFSSPPPFSTQTCRGVESIKQTPEYQY